MAWRIKTVVQKTGVPAETLRSWERRYKVVEPERSEKGYRLYSDADLALLTHIKGLVDDGLAISEAIGQARQEGRLEQAPALPLPAPPANQPIGPEPMRAARAELLRALLDMDRHRADNIVVELQPVPWERALQDLLLPVLRELSWLRERGKASLAQERFSKALLGERMAAMMAALGGGPASGPEATCAGAPGDADELEPRAAALLLALRGWRVCYLAADLPLAELGPLLQERRPGLHWTSLTGTLGREERLGLYRRLRGVAPASTRICVGGGGVSGLDGPSPVPGVELFRSLADLPHSA